MKKPKVKTTDIVLANGYFEINEDYDMLGVRKGPGSWAEKIVIPTSKWQPAEYKRGTLIWRPSRKAK